MSLKRLGSIQAILNTVASKLEADNFLNPFCTDLMHL